MAATNTLAGWLYLISGLMVAMLLVAILLVRRALDGLEVRLSPLPPIHAGDRVSVALTLHNSRPAPSQPVQVISGWPLSLAAPAQITVESIAARTDRRCFLTTTAAQRGLYRWPSVILRTAAPLGLFWYRRASPAPARLAVYPQIISLSRCPILDDLTGLSLQDNRLLALRQRRADLDTAGTMRSLRPYRWGDPLRLVHWRSSARYGQLRTREMEESFNQRQITVALDQGSWQADHFEQAVTVAASLVRYALDHRIGVQLWTAETGAVTDVTAMMETLAQIDFEAGGEAGTVEGSPDRLSSAHSASNCSGQEGYIGLTSDLSGGSRPMQAGIPQAWVVWPARLAKAYPKEVDGAEVLQIRPDQPLQPQLQRK